MGVHRITDMANKKPSRMGWLTPCWLHKVGQELIVLLILGWILIRQRRGPKSWAALTALWALRLKVGAKFPSGFSPHYFPLIGNQLLLMSMLRRGPSPVMRELFAAHGYRAMTFSAPGMNAVVPASQADLKHILKTNWHNYRKNYDGDLGFDVNFKEVMGEGVFAVDGDKWKVHRKVASHLFSVSKLKSKMESVFNDHSTRLVKALQQLQHDKKPVDLQNLFQCFTFDTMCDIAFGVSPGAVEMASCGDKPEFLESFDFAQTVCLLRMLKPPLVWKTERYLRLGDEAELPAHGQRMQEYLQDIVDKRRAELKSNGNSCGRGDLLSLYIEYGVKNNDPKILEDQYLKDMIMNFMIAGRDTTSCLLTNLFKLLTEHPEHMERLSNELSPESTEHDWLVNNAPFADCCINEALRMFPPVGSDGRYCVAEDTLPSGTVVKPGNIVMIANYSLGRNPKLFEDPDSFNPDRWDAKDKIHQTHEYDVPVFWAGNRLCLGKDMARFEAKVACAHIMKAGLRFELIQTPESKAADRQGLTYSQSPVMFYRRGVMVRVI